MPQTQSLAPNWIDLESMGWSVPGWFAPGWFAPGWFAPGWFAPGCQMGLPPGSKLRARSNSGWFDRWFGQTPQAT